MDCNSIPWAFAKNYLIGGLFIALYATIAECTKSHLGGFIYGFLPLIFVYNILVINFTKDSPTEENEQYSLATLIGAIGFYLFIVFTWVFLRRKCSTIVSLFLAMLCSIPVVWVLYLINKRITTH